MAEYKETDINYVAGDNYISVSTGVKKYINKIITFKEQFPEYINIIENFDGTMCARFSTERFSMPFIKIKREMSEEQKEMARERMKEMWEKEER